MLQFRVGRIDLVGVDGAEVRLEGPDQVQEGRLPRREDRVQRSGGRSGSRARRRGRGVALVDLHRVRFTTVALDGTGNGDGDMTDIATARADDFEAFVFLVEAAGEDVGVEQLDQDVFELGD
mgnify:FL=1